MESADEILSRNSYPAGVTGVRQYAYQLYLYSPEDMAKSLSLSLENLRERFCRQIDELQQAIKTADEWREKRKHRDREQRQAVLQSGPGAVSDPAAAFGVVR